MNPDQEASYRLLVRKCQSTAAGPWKLAAEQWVQQLLDARSLLTGAGVLVAVPLAQAILESGWGAQPFLFGIKATQADFLAGQAKKTVTHEIVNGESVVEADYFFCDQTIRGNVARYVQYLQKMKPEFGRYGKDDIQGFLDYLETPPRYSTAVNIPMDYYATIASVIHDNLLWAWDA